MTISTETKTGRNLEDICGVGNEKTVLSYKQLAGYAIILAETIQVMQDHVRTYEKALEHHEVKLPSIIGSILPDYLNVRDKVVVDVEDLADADPMILGDTVQLDLNQFIQICENVPPLCWSHFIGKTDGAAQLRGLPRTSLEDLADELYEVSSEASVAVRKYIEANCPKQWDVCFTHLIEQTMTITVEAATKEEAKQMVKDQGLDATEQYDGDIEREDGDIHDICMQVASVERNEDDE